MARTAAFIASRFSLLFIFLVFSPLCLISQDYEWWNKKHNWDGVTHWSQYIILSPGYMGPNALPVQEIRTGEVEKDIYLETSFDAHFSKGDKTQNVFTRFHYPFAGNKIAFEVLFIPWEHYKMDTITRDERRVRTRSGEGTTVGDLRIGTVIQILKDRGSWPDILLSANFSTASGGKFEDARYIDAMSYQFDISAGKDIKLGQSGKVHIRPYGLVGFGAWQTRRVDNFQDDALLYGIGLNLSVNKLLIYNQLGGYRGHFNNRDRPMVYRFRVIFSQKVINYKIEYQQGLHDFDYSTIRAGIQVKFGTKKRSYASSR